MKIQSVYKKGDIFFEIINAWNNLPEKNKRTAIYIKKRIKEFLKNEYVICKFGWMSQLFEYYGYLKDIRPTI